MNLLICTQKVDKNDPILGFFHRWIEEFSKHCESVLVICLQEGEHNLPENVKVLSLGKEGGESRMKYIKRFYRYILRHRSEYTHVFVHMNPEYVVLGGIPWRLMKKRVALWYTHKHVDIKLRIAEKLTHVIFTASKESFRLESLKVHIVGHGIDVELFKPGSKKNDGAQTILTVGRINPIKNIHLLIKAFSGLKKAKDSRLVIVGKPLTDNEEEYLVKLKKLVRELNIEDNVLFEGSKTQVEVVSYYQTADVFVNLSDTGSLDKAVLEALLTETPVVSSNTAFADLLNPYGLHIRSTESRQVIKAINVALNIRKEEKQRLRRNTQKEHSLSLLIPRLITLMNHEKTS